MLATLLQPACALRVGNLAGHAGMVLSLATDGKIDETVNQWYCAACWFAYESGAAPGAAASGSSGGRPSRIVSSAAAASSGDA